MPLEDRLAELERDLDRIIALAINQQETIDSLEDRHWKLLRLLGKRLGIRK